jgi:hypothetical protein
MPRIAAWISGQVWHPLADNPMTLTTVTRLGWGALYFIVILMMQGVDVRAFADPNQSAAWADVRIAVVLVEAALLIWTVWLVATFWRARSRSR